MRRDGALDGTQHPKIIALSKRRRAFSYLPLLPPSLIFSSIREGAGCCVPRRGGKVREDKGREDKRRL
jgi:hypothetical protein